MASPHHAGSTGISYTKFIGEFIDFDKRLYSVEKFLLGNSFVQIHFTCVHCCPWFNCIPPGELYKQVLWKNDNICVLYRCFSERVVSLRKSSACLHTCGGCIGNRNECG